MKKNKNYVYILHQEVIDNDDDEKKLKKEIFDYINKDINSIWTIFNKKEIIFFDYFTAKDQSTYSYMSTCEPHNNNKFNALLFEIYAFTYNNDINIFKDYDLKIKTFSDNKREIKLYKLKI